MSIFDFMEKYGHEKMIFFYDKTTGLKGITGIHDTKLGPAIGGTRLYNYKCEEDAIFDVVRLSRGMTYKCAIADFNLGGGKTVLIGDPSKVKNEAYLRSYGRHIQSLNGMFYTGEDMNISEHDVDYMLMESNFFNGRADLSGNPSPVTAYGVYWGMKACAMERWGSDSLEGKTVAIQGVGAVGYTLCEFLHKEGAKLVITDTNEANLQRAKEAFNAEVVGVEDIYAVDCDVFSPNSIGAILNDETIPRLKCEIVAGAANNVLLDEEKDGNMLKDRGILYAPDYVINGGGVINVVQEFWPPYNEERALREVKKIYKRLLNIFKFAKEKDINTQKAANLLAEQRIETISKMRSNFLPNEKNIGE